MQTGCQHVKVLLKLCLPVCCVRGQCQFSAQEIQCSFAPGFVTYHDEPNLRHIDHRLYYASRIQSRCRSFALSRALPLRWTTWIWPTKARSINFRAALRAIRRKRLGYCWAETTRDRIRTQHHCPVAWRLVPQKKHLQMQHIHTLASRADSKSIFPKIDTLKVRELTSNLVQFLLLRPPARLFHRYRNRRASMYHPL